MRNDAPKTTTARSCGPQSGGRSTTSAAGIAHIAPGGNGPTSAITPELLTSKQAAKLLNIGERSLWRWSRSGVCPPPIKIGTGRRATVRYRRAELEKWCDDGCPPTDRRDNQ